MGLTLFVENQLRSSEYCKTMWTKSLWLWNIESSLTIWEMLYHLTPGECSKNCGDYWKPTIVPQRYYPKAPGIYHLNYIHGRVTVGHFVRYFDIDAISHLPEK